VPVQIEEWNAFVGLFNSFGFSVNSDVADAVWEDWQKCHFFFMGHEQSL